MEVHSLYWTPKLHKYVLTHSVIFKCSTKPLHFINIFTGAPNRASEFLLILLQYKRDLDYIYSKQIIFRIFQNSHLIHTTFF
jgi:hypothetical protein